MVQLTVDDAIAEREAALAKVEAGAGTAWIETALETIRAVARSQARFTPDAIWQEGLALPPEPRALGVAMRAAAMKGIIRATNVFEPSKRPTQHRTPIRVWESLIYKEA